MKISFRNFELSYLNIGSGLKTPITKSKGKNIFETPPWSIFNTKYNKVVERLEIF